MIKDTKIKGPFKRAKCHQDRAVVKKIWTCMTKKHSFRLYFTPTSGFSGNAVSLHIGQISCGYFLTIVALRYSITEYRLGLGTNGTALKLDKTFSSNIINFIYMNYASNRVSPLRGSCQNAGFW